MFPKTIKSLTGRTAYPDTLKGIRHIQNKAVPIPPYIYTSPQIRGIFFFRLYIIFNIYKDLQGFGFEGPVNGFLGPKRASWKGAVTINDKI
jgi:hypothetical protein